MKTSAIALILVLVLALGAIAQDAPELVTPTYGQHCVPATGTRFAWLPKARYHNWELQVADNPWLAHPLVQVQVMTTHYRFAGTLPAWTHLYWRVFYINDEGQWYYSCLGHFWTAPVIHRPEFLDEEVHQATHCPCWTKRPVDTLRRARLWRGAGGGR